MKLGNIADFSFAPHPFSAAACWDVAVLESRSTSGASVRLWAAALRLMWGDGNTWRPAATLSSCGWDIGKLGDEVAEELLRKRGVTVAELRAVGSEALRRVLSDLPGREAIKATEGFSEGPAGAPPARS